MSLSVGIVGLPNVGKSTLFNALLKRQQALAANYPFATIEPNTGVVPVPDTRLEQLAQVVKEAEKLDRLPPLVPATVEFVDIAGIVAGAHKGEGLGNKFLSHIREVELIAHVVRDFADTDVVQTGQGMETDYHTITSELILKDLETVEKAQLAAKKDRTPVGQEKSRILQKLLEGFNQNQRASQALRPDESAQIHDLFLLSAKPQIIVVNVDESRIKEAESIGVSVAQKLAIKAEDIVVISAKIESEIASLDEADAQLFMEDLGLKQSGLERLIQTAYGRLGLISFLTAGEKEVRAWTIMQGSSAPESAGVIHTDFIKKFIKAEIVNWEDFVTLGGWKKARELGKVRLEGRDYVMQDGDVVDFKIGS